MRLLESGEPWFAAAQALLVGVAVALAAGLGVRMLARRVLRNEDRAQHTSLVAFWGVVAIFGIVALTRLIGGETADAGLATAGNRLFTTLPDLVIALVLVIVGSVLATAARRAVTRWLADRPRYADSLGSAAAVSVVAVAVLLAIRQIGVQTFLVDALVVAAAAGLALALGLAAGVGGRRYAEALTAGRHAEDILTVGDLIEVDGRRGRVLRLGGTSVRIGLPGGAIAEVPNHRLLAQTVVVFEHEDDAVDGHAPATAAAPLAEQPEQSHVEAEAPAAVSVDDEAQTRVFQPTPGSSAEREATSLLDRKELERERARLRDDDRR